MPEIVVPKLWAAYVIVGKEIDGKDSRRLATYYADSEEDAVNAAYENAGVTEGFVAAFTTRYGSFFCGFDREGDEFETFSNNVYKSGEVYGGFSPASAKDHGAKSRQRSVPLATAVSEAFSAAGYRIGLNSACTPDEMVYAVYLMTRAYAGYKRTEDDVYDYPELGDKFVWAGSGKTWTVTHVTVDEVRYDVYDPTDGERSKQRVSRKLWQRPMEAAEAAVIGDTRKAVPHG